MDRKNITSVQLNFTEVHVQSSDLTPKRKGRNSTVKRIEIKEDEEQITLAQDEEVNDDFDLERPLSPVIKCRRELISSIRNRLKSEANLEEQVSRSQKQELNAENFSYQKNDDSLSCLEKLEIIQKHRETVYKNLAVKTNYLISERESSTSHTIGKNVELDIANDFPELCEKVSLVRQPPIELPKSSNFQTATGKTISIDPRTIVKQCKIFKDILGASEGESRKNKNNFLKKPQFLSNDKSLVNDVSLPEEICDFGISDTQMIFAADNITSSQSEFRGFNQEEMSAANALNNQFDGLREQNCRGKNSDKRKLEEIMSPAIKRIKFTEEFLKPAAASSFNLGFSSAAGQKISVATNSLSKARNIFEDICLDANTSVHNCPEQKKVIRTTNDTKSTRIVKQKLEFFDNLLKSEKELVAIQPLRAPQNIGMFSTASGKDLQPPISTLSKSAGIFEDISVKNAQASETKEDKIRSTNKRKLEFFDNLLDNDNELVIQPLQAPQNLGMFSTASGKGLQPSKSALSKSAGVFDDILKTDTSCKNAQVSETKEDKIRSTNKRKLEFFDKLLGEDTVTDSIPIKMPREPPLKFLPASRSGLSKSSHTLNDNNSTPIKNFNTPDSSTKKFKRKLGISACKQISLPESKLQMAKQLFGEDLLSGISPIKPLKDIAPLAFNLCSTPLKNISDTYLEANETLDNSKTIIDQQEEVKELKLKDDCIVTFENPTAKEDFGPDFMEEITKMKQRLAVLTKRTDEIAKLAQEVKPESDKKPKEGVLYRSKIKRDRLSLKSFVHNEKPGKKIEKELFCVTPQNATDIHFKESSVTLTTSDGATIIPNVKDLIGLNEIELAFHNMKGVDPKLIPNGWIKNHYKWIIWKLASYERAFSDNFKGALTVENVMLQLKYRYDREIDKAQRPAIRKILEKDDSSRKRMVLCVSSIKNVNSNQFELELTDGWYGIRTVVDEPLCQQIRSENLQVGTKLVIWAAELMNCDGCHPLDVADFTYLKINFNCTRRAKWDVRLGYQNPQGPFSIPLHSVHPDGGIIGSIDVCIARTYPFKYMDKTEYPCVIRNEKAEERRAQEWENSKYKQLEKMEDDVIKELSLTFNKENKSRGSKNINVDISGVTCPKTLMEIMETSRDPESLQEKLSTSQKSALLDYRQNLQLKKQEILAERIKSSTDKLKLNKRDVVPIMKMLVVDLNGNPTKDFNFFLWKPSDQHCQMLKEGKCYSIYNVLPKTNGYLNSTSRTVFKPRTDIGQLNVKFKRHLLPIKNLNYFTQRGVFNEFDTVGIVVETKINSNGQEIWLSDTSGRLLQINILESPATCSLLDTLKRGQATSACNLEYSYSQEDIVQARAHYFTIFSSYPKFKHLQDGLDELKKTMPKDVSQLLKDCDAQIEKFRGRLSWLNFSTSCEEDDTLSQSRITKSDIALSLVDIDKFQ